MILLNQKMEKLVVFFQVRLKTQNHPMYGQNLRYSYEKW